MFEVKRAKTDEEIRACLYVREQVFIVEQDISPDIERDALDASAFHFLALLAGSPIGAARVVLVEGGSLAKIGRVAVLKAERGRGAGGDIMVAIENDFDLALVDGFVLEAQVRALAFYERLGYEPYGDEFMEAGIPHRKMKKERKEISFP